MTTIDQTTTPSKPRGAFIVLEGCDRCGKTTQVNLLAKSIPNAMTLKFPDRSSVTGQAIHQYLTRTNDLMINDDKTIHLLFAQNRREQESRIRELLANGTHLIVDRYAFSGVAYSVAKGLDIEWCMRPDVGLPRPDLVLYLDLPASVAAARSGYGDERYETVFMQSKVRNVFIDDLKDDQYWKLVDANLPIDQIHSVIMHLVTQHALEPAGKGDPIPDLWVDKLARLDSVPTVDQLISQEMIAP